ncbi:MAG: dual CXXC motif small (seleno)protein [Thermodesulfobacteriota bacterium]
MRCRSCNAEFTLEQYHQQMDEEFERQVGNIRCDRL